MAGWLHRVFVGDWLFVFPLCGFSLSLFCNYLCPPTDCNPASLAGVLNGSMFLHTQSRKQHRALVSQFARGIQMFEPHTTRMTCARPTIGLTGSLRHMPDARGAGSLGVHALYT